MNKAAGSYNKDGYLEFHYMRKHHRVHRVIWEMHYGLVNPGVEIDHKNNIRNDNRIENLQELIHGDNSKKQLLRKNSKTGYRGVSFKVDLKKFRARITVNGKTKFLGYFDTAEEAYEARKIAELHYYGSKLMVAQ
jgi:hypothetical protein